MILIRKKEVKIKLWQDMKIEKTRSFGNKLGTGRANE
jgi:hypothetical protein